MTTILHSPVSVVHLVAALTALGTGTYVLLTPKGTSAHQFIGRVYVVSMGVLLLSAFQIYYLFGRFGIIHWGAAGSAVTLLIGMGAIRWRAIVTSWFQWHYVGMGASVTGLYAAFAVECTYRLFPPSLFWWATLGSANIVFGLGGWLLYQHYPDWAARIKPLSGKNDVRRGGRDVNPANPVVCAKVI